METIDKTAQKEKVAHRENGKLEKVTPPVKNLPLSQIYVSSEIGQLQRLIVHSPDAGIGKVVPRKSQDWLYDDIVDIDKIVSDTKIKIG